MALLHGALMFRAAWLEKIGMQKALAVLTLAMGTSIGALSLAHVQADGDSQAALAFARRAAVRALNFQQGDRDALVAVRQLFTEEGWTQFRKNLQAFLDPTDAPLFTSTFVASGDGRVVDERDGITHVHIPGTLTQSAGRGSRTTYTRFAVDVWVGGTPLAVHRLTQMTCAGASTACE